MKKLPDYVPLNIENLESFLEESKDEFNRLRETAIVETVNLSDFTIIRHIGQGGYGDVFLVKNHITGLNHAMKRIYKVTKYEIDYIENETNLLRSMNFHFIIRMEFYFTDEFFVHYIMPFINRGDMFDLLKTMKHFDENLVRFYCAQLVLGLEYLHHLDIVYRDLKPENVVIDHTGYTKIIDFGFAKVVKTRTCSICGTPEYVAPEIILRVSYGKAVDWWSLGVLLFEMASGYSPFYHKNTMKIFELASSMEYKMPDHFSSELQDLVKNLLQTDLTRRFGNLKDGVDDIKNHKWFRPIIWSSVLNKTMEVPFVPEERALLENMEDIVSREVSGEKYNSKLKSRILNEKSKL